MNLPKTQRGMTPIGVASIVMLVAIVALMGLKLIPTYLESWKVDTMLESLANENGLSKQPPRQIWKTMEKRMRIDSITTIKREHVVFLRTNKGMKISVEWEVQTPVMGNVDFLVFFSKETEIN